MLKSFLQSIPARDTLSGIFSDRRGATAIEYGLIAAGIAVVVIAAITLIGNNLAVTFNNVASHL